MLPTVFSEAEVFQATIFLGGCSRFLEDPGLLFQQDSGLNGLSVQQLFSGPQIDFLPLELILISHTLPL